MQRELLCLNEKYLQERRKLRLPMIIALVTVHGLKNGAHLNVDSPSTRWTCILQHLRIEQCI